VWDIGVGWSKNRVGVRLVYNQIVKHKHQMAGDGGSDYLMSKKEKFMEKLEAKRNSTTSNSYYFNDAQKEYVSTPEPNLPTPEKQSKTSFWVALGFDVLGIVFISAGYAKNQDLLRAYDRYSDISSSGGDYRGAWKKVEDERNSRNMFYVLGGIFLASGIGVHIWF